MSKEIEEIKKRWFPLGFVGNSQDQKDVRFLLSSLEKEEQTHTMDVLDLNMKIAELGIALEKEKEKYLRIVRGEFKQICSYCGWEAPPPNGWEELQSHIQVCSKHPLIKEKERADNIEKHYIQTLEDWNTERNYDRECLRKAEERAKELVEAMARYKNVRDCLREDAKAVMGSAEIPEYEEEVK